MTTTRVFEYVLKGNDVGRYPCDWCERLAVRYTTNRYGDDPPGKVIRSFAMACETHAQGFVVEEDYNK